MEERGEILVVRIHRSATDLDLCIYMYRAKSANLNTTSGWALPTWASTFARLKMRLEVTKEASHLQVQVDNCALQSDQPTVFDLSRCENYLSKGEKASHLF